MSVGYQRNRIAENLPRLTADQRPKLGAGSGVARERVVPSELVKECNFHPDACLDTLGDLFLNSDPSAYRLLKEVLSENPAMSKEILMQLGPEKLGEDAGSMALGRWMAYNRQEGLD